MLLRVCTTVAKVATATLAVLYLVGQESPDSHLPTDAELKSAFTDLLLSMSCDLSAALQTACAEVIGEPVQQVKLTAIYEAKLTGSSIKQFHDSCDSLEAPTLTLLVNNTQTYAVGGYTTVPWRSEDHAFIPDPHSFLFHLRGSSRGYESFLHGPLDHSASIYCGASAGPIFGRGKRLSTALKRLVLFLM